MSTNGPGVLVIERILRDRESIRQRITEERDLNRLTGQMLAVAFAPISLFFLITAPDYGFFKLLDVAVMTLSAVVGLRFLTGGMQVLKHHGLLTPAPAGEPATSPAAAVPATVTPAPAQPAPVHQLPAAAPTRPGHGQLDVSRSACSGRCWSPGRGSSMAWPVSARRARRCCTSGSCCSGSSARSSAGPCGRSSAARVSRSR
ncbi:hypothetical protein [Micromonospora sp. NPDC049679]|uniref:hypothetical protein n=1 Tax=Micromonospora sp. NPDC049679 TaxID=3155920 RepID=UPI0033D02EE7